MTIQMSDLDRQFRDQIKENKDIQASQEELGQTYAFEQDLIFVSDPKNPYKILKNELSNLQNHLEELGLWSFKKAFDDFLQRWSKVKVEDAESEWKMMLHHLSEIRLTYIETLLPKVDEDNVEKLLEYSSQKLRALIEWLKEKANNYKTFHAIVFVERRSTAYYLNLVLTQLGEKYPFIKSNFMHGDAKGAIDVPMDLKKQVNGIF